MTAKKTDNKPERYIKNEAVPTSNNPFAEDLLLEVKPGSQTIAFAGNAAMVDKETGEALGDVAVIGVKRRVDRTEFVKLYERGIRATFELKPASLGVFSVLLEAYRRDKFNGEKIYFSFQSAVNDYLYDKHQKTFRSGLNELLNKKFLAEVKGERNLYWVNPSLFYKGDRLRIVNEFVTGKEKEIESETKKEGKKELPNDPAGS